MERLYTNCTRANDQQLGQDAISTIIDLYAPTWYVRSPLIIQLEEEEAKLEELTEQQFIVLDTLSRLKRVAIYGCAGSGKTFLAVEQARRFAKQGRKVLLTCITGNLADWLGRLLEKQAETEPALENIQVSTFHRLFSRVKRQAEEAGILLHSNRANANDPLLEGGSLFSSFGHNSYYEIFDKQLLRVIPHSGECYDAIIVDEGQDFEDTGWTMLKALLRSEKESLFYIFYDENQRSEGRNLTYPVRPEFHYPLTCNCRTTQKIHEAVITFYLTGDPPSCKGPEGRAIEQIRTERYGNDEQVELADLLKRLTQDDQIPLEDIVLLSPVKEKNSRFHDGLELSNGFKLSWELDKASEHNTFTCSSISAFKGLERKVVILVEPDKIWDDTLMYVALSRAKLHLIILGYLPYFIYKKLRFAWQY